jgi:hypothetical protein
VRVPDYVSPVVGYRVWRWDAAGLKSLNGVPWVPGQALAARCNLVKVWEAGRIRHVSHDAPQPDCRCGVYASKNLGDLRGIRVWESGVRGEAWLWGTVVSTSADGGRSSPTREPLSCRPTSCQSLSRKSSPG